MTMNATPAKLKNGSWGARVETSTLGKTAVRGELEGTTVTVRTRAGKTWDAEVEKVVWIGEERGKSIALCATVNRDRPQRCDAHRTARSSGRLSGMHTHNHCGCGNWSGVGSPCLYSYGEAKDEGEHRYITWVRE